MSSIHFAIYILCLERFGFKNKSDICHVLYEEVFMLDVTRSNLDVEKEFGIVLLTPKFYKI